MPIIIGLILRRQFSELDRSSIFVESTYDRLYERAYLSARRRCKVKVPPILFFPYPSLQETNRGANRPTCSLTARAPIKNASAQRAERVGGRSLLCLLMTQGASGHATFTYSMIHSSVCNDRLTDQSIYLLVMTVAGEWRGKTGQRSVRPAEMKRKYQVKQNVVFAQVIKRYS